MRERRTAPSSDAKRPLGARPGGRSASLDAAASGAASVLLALLVDVLGEGAEVELDDLGVVGELAAGAAVGVSALVEHVAAVADLQAATGVLLDHHDADAGLVD